jgi:hypothetical protein
MLKSGAVWLEKLWNVLISLKLAVLVIVSLALTLSAATVIESMHDTRTAQYFVYRAAWFYALLSVLGLNILAVALSRLPWKKRHLPFLLAHAGILMILAGSWLTYVKGVDGSLLISEGEMNSAVELDEFVLVSKRGEEVRTAPFPWMPVSVARSFQPREFPELGIRVERYVSDAERVTRYFPVEASNPESAPAVQIRVLGAPMGGAPEFWLFGGDPGSASQKLGPARFLIRREEQKDLEAPSSGEDAGEARLDFIVSKAGALRFQSVSVRGEKKSGSVDLKKLQARDEPVIIDPGWKMPIRLHVKSFLPSALMETRYVERKVKPVGMGTAQPEPAIEITISGNPASRLWLGLGDRANFQDGNGMPVTAGYFPRRLLLPYGLRLERFEMTTNPGTNDPATYSSRVQVVDQFQKTEADLRSLPVHHITMNEPLEWKGYTFYQSSYVPEIPRPVTTILSVNYDPGRGLKYWGSVLLILGSVALYLAKVVKKKKTKEFQNA